MAKEWILNGANMRWGLTRKNKVGPVAEHIRKCYKSEIQTIYGRLEEKLGVRIQPAPDEWDRGYNVDFYIDVKGKYIGLQIKPAGYAYITQIINELEFQKNTHEEFTKKFGGKVFYIISITEGKNKIIHNPEIISEIQREIVRLSSQ